MLVEEPDVFSTQSGPALPVLLGSCCRRSPRPLSGLGCVCLVDEGGVPEAEERWAGKDPVN